MLTTVAIIHKADVSPTKSELLERVLGEPLAMLGSYRLDDPDGEVGVEGFVVRAGDRLHHVVLTYRGTPLAGAEDALVSTMEHSVLGRRWIYDGTDDPVAVACLRRALLGEQDQAVEEMWENGRRVGTVERTVRLAVVPGPAPRGDASLTISTGLDESVTRARGPQLRADWPGGSAVIARIGPGAEHRSDQDGTEGGSPQPWEART